MGNTHLRDKNLSLKAVGLLSKMLSFNDGWQFSTRGLAALCKEGPDAILSALKELEENGYLVRHRGRDDKGEWSARSSTSMRCRKPVCHTGIIHTGKIPMWRIQTWRIPIGKIPHKEILSK